MPKWSQQFFTTMLSLNAARPLGAKSQLVVVRRSNWVLLLLLGPLTSHTKQAPHGSVMDDAPPTASALRSLVC